MFKNKLLVALLLTLTAPAAFAIDGIYVTGSLGRSNVSGLKSSYDSFLSGVGVTGLSSTEKNNDTAFKLMAGYQINPNFAVEGGYTDLGKFTQFAAAVTGLRTSIA